MHLDNLSPVGLYQSMLFVRGIAYTSSSRGPPQMRVTDLAAHATAGGAGSRIAIVRAAISSARLHALGLGFVHLSDDPWGILGNLGVLRRSVCGPATSPRDNTDLDHLPVGALHDERCTFILVASVVSAFFHTEAYLEILVEQAALLLGEVSTCILRHLWQACDHLRWKLHRR